MFGSSGVRAFGCSAGTILTGVWLVFAVLIVSPGRGWAHDGPPYAILVDRQAGPYTLSVWADPDVGTGTFYIALEPPSAGARGEPTVELRVRPVSRRIPEERYLARRQPSRDGLRYYAEARFDTQERWSTRFILNGTQGAGEAETSVEVTPPGLGPVDLLIYLAPFLTIGFLWIKAALYRRQAGG